MKTDLKNQWSKPSWAKISVDKEYDVCAMFQYPSTDSNYEYEYRLDQYYDKFRKPCIDIAHNLNCNVAKLNNADLLIAKLDYQIAEKDLDIEKAKLSPSASINYSKSENKDFSSTVDEVDQETLKATITWPIIKGGENISSIKKSSLEKQKSLLLSEDAENRVVSETTKAWSTYQSSESVLKATESQLKAAEIANEGITVEYETGLGRTTLDVIQSNTILLTSKINLANSERNFFLSQLELLKSVGLLNAKYLNIIK